MMRLEEISSGNYQIYVNQGCYQNLDISKKEVIADYAKELVLKLRHHFGISLYGFYEMKIYVADSIGMFIYLKRLDDEDDYFSSLDLKVMIFLHQKFYLKTPNFDFISTCPTILYSKGYYYIELSSINLFFYLELGEIVLECMEQERLKNALVIRKDKSHSLKKEIL